MEGSNTICIQGKNPSTHEHFEVVGFLHMNAQKIVDVIDIRKLMSHVDARKAIKNVVFYMKVMMELSGMAHQTTDKYPQMDYYQQH